MKKTTLVVFTFLFSLFARDAIADTAAFYVISNKPEMNTIVGFRKEDTAAGYRVFGEFPTGGQGTGDLEIPALKKDESHPLANGDDPLISANALVFTSDRKHLIAVNPGNATLSLMAVHDDQTLTVANTVPASDKFPVSVAAFGDLGYTFGRLAVTELMLEPPLDQFPIANEVRPSV